MKKKTNKAKNSELRSKAEEELNYDVVPIEMLSDVEVRTLAHELRVHQVELEMQNDELRKAQQEIRTSHLEIEESQQMYLDLYDFAPVGYITIGEDRLIMEANLRIASMLEVERMVLLKKPLSKFILREDEDKYFMCWRHILETKERETCELMMVKKNGTTFYAQLECLFMQNEDKNQEQCRIIISDISERKRMEEALIQSEKLKSIGFMTAGISHEFNNILNIIGGFVELLQVDYKGDSKLIKTLSTIEESVDDGAKITNNMLEFTKTSKDTSSSVCSDICENIKQAMDFTMPRWKNQAFSKGINYDLVTVGIKSVPSILCNPVEIREVFINIIVNSLDAMPDGGTLSFRTWSKDDTVFVSITDTGVGMTEDVKRNVFDPFFTTKSPEGTGLGMSTAYSKVVRNGGNIKVHSEVGSGSRFTLQFPATTEIVSPEVSHVPDRRITIRKLHILIIDDNKDILEIMNNVLNRGGHTVKTVDNGVKAIELARKEDFDLVLCDLLMLDLHGYEVIKTINRLGKIPKIGIMTGWGENPKSDDDVEFKADFILKKPFKHAELAGHITDLFGVDSK